MKRIVLSFVAAVPMLALAHPGGVDASGCHDDRKTGEHHCHPGRVLASSLSTCELKQPPRRGDEGVFYGPLVRVRDGDSFEAKVQGVAMEFRLAETDAPEWDQPYGREAARALESLLRNRELVLVPVDTDAYGRTVVFVWIDSLCVNKEMVRRGAAWFYDQYAYSAALHAVETAARDAKAGLWALPLEQRMEPWVWRKEKR